MLAGLGITILIAGYFFWRLWKHYLIKPSYEIDVSWKNWYLLFLLAVGTHPILDCFTVYGTQLFWPFNEARIAISNISVADPIYTFPFLLCVLVASFLHRSSKSRFNWNLAGVVISSLYMCFTLYNQAITSKVLKSTLSESNITYDRFLVTPSIFNNILWRATVESDSTYYLGMYSFFDEEKVFQLSPIAGNHHLVKGFEEDHTLNKLRFFSNDYYGIMELENGTLQLNDLRYGTFKGDGSKSSDYIFHFLLEEHEGQFQLGKTEAGPQEGEGENMLADLWSRIKGNLD